MHYDRVPPVIIESNLNRPYATSIKPLRDVPDIVYVIDSDEDSDYKNSNNDLK
jgi:hypothetical protein